MSRSAPARRSSGPAKPPANATGLEGYFHRSELPLASLIFLLPMIVAYEVGVRRAAAMEITASRLLMEFFDLFGATGHSLPALAVVGILLACHIARKDPWRIDLATLGGMGLESVLLVAPVMMLLALVRHWCVLAGGAGVRTQVLLSFGAGIYEELVFRLIAFGLLSLLLMDVLKLPKRLAVPLVVFVSSVAFSLYHYLGPEPFYLQTFAFRTAAGAYFGLIFLFRGFGITAGCHAAYDIVAILLSRLG